MNWCRNTVVITCFLVHTAASAAPLNQDVKIDILMEKITSLMRADRAVEALPYFEELEATGTPLPERFYYHYISTLEKSGNPKKTVARAEDYINRFGRKGANYSNVIAIMGRVSLQLDKVEKENAQRRALKAELIKKFEAIESDILRLHRYAILSTKPPEYFEFVPRYKAVILEYNEKIQEPAMGRLEELLKKRELLQSQGVPEELNAEILEMSADVGVVSNRDMKVLSDFYSAMESLRTKSDARVIEAIRRKSWAYSRLEEKKWTWKEATTQIQEGIAKFERTMSNW